MQIRVLCEKDKARGHQQNVCSQNRKIVRRESFAFCMQVTCAHRRDDWMQPGEFFGLGTQRELDFSVGIAQHSNTWANETFQVISALDKDLDHLLLLH